MNVNNVLDFKIVNESSSMEKQFPDEQQEFNLENENLNSLRYIT